ncbi:hypothetical protein DM02DRAFT_190953 [Periconia macrospinosa]|uniref:Uncharacterized protein n=1 Tax=Periconia macrospinosa TaxID=97972 RepID=A0A2V1D8Q9_9PLEO|nr:hypothetical protein DM02DRAFT_190953 [Periconia macrospinosa]
MASTLPHFITPPSEPRLQTSPSLLSALRHTQASLAIQRSKLFSTVLFTLALLAIITHLLTSSVIPSLSTDFAHTIAAATPSACTTSIGDSICCSLFSEAEPCVEECRRKFMDRETMEVRAGFGECKDMCLTTYHDEGCNEKSGKEMVER